MNTIWYKIYNNLAAARGKKSPVPGMMTNKAYPTLVGDPDLSWYFGLDPELKIDDLDLPTQNQASTVEVNVWTIQKTLTLLTPKARYFV